MLLAMERILDKLERRIILDELLPLLWDVRLQDPDIIQATVSEYPNNTSNRLFSLNIKTSLHLSHCFLISQYDVKDTYHSR